MTKPFIKPQSRFVCPNKQDSKERGCGMKFYELIRRCLENEAVRTEPDRNAVIRKVLKEIEKWKKNN